MCLSLENKRLLRALIAFFQVWALHQPNVARFRDGLGLRGSLIPSSLSKNLPGFAGFGFPWKPSLWVRFFQQEVTKVAKSAYVSLCRFASFWCILLLRICSRLHWLLPSPARSQLFSWEKETTHPPFLGARAAPAPDPPSCSRSSLGWEAAKGIGLAPFGGFALSVALFTACNSFYLGFSLCKGYFYAERPLASVLELCHAIAPLAPMAG